MSPDFFVTYLPDRSVLAVLIVLKTIAELLGILIDAQAGEWRRADETS